MDAAAVFVVMSQAGRSMSNLDPPPFSVPCVFFDGPGMVVLSDGGV